MPFTHVALSSNLAPRTNFRIIMLAIDVKPGDTMYIIHDGMMGILEVEHIIEFTQHRRFILNWVINPWKNDGTFGFIDFDRYSEVQKKYWNYINHY